MSGHIILRVEGIYAGSHSYDSLLQVSSRGGQMVGQSGWGFITSLLKSFHHAGQSPSHDIFPCAKNSTSLIGDDCSCPSFIYITLSSDLVGRSPLFSYPSPYFATDEEKAPRLRILPRMMSPLIAIRFDSSFLDFSGQLRDPLFLGVVYSSCPSRLRRSLYSKILSSHLMWLVMSICSRYIYIYR